MSVNMQLDNWPKFVFALVAVACMTALMITGTVTSEVGVPFLTWVGGYMLGNGVRAVQGKTDQPIFQPYGRRNSDREGTQ